MATGAAGLIARQNADGGWSYGRGSSWTEPTCYALMGLCAGGIDGSAAIGKALAWLDARRNADGGWPPRAGVAESTWVTALVALLPDGIQTPARRESAIRWLASAAGAESGAMRRLRLWMLGVRRDPDQSWKGWPWFPGEAAWVTPTAFSVLALERAGPGDADAAARAGEGRAFLLARRCRDGGWNHGSTHALGYEARSYPETTGVALLALHGAGKDSLASSIAAARSHLEQARSREAGLWLELALRAHGVEPAPSSAASRGSVVELALELLTAAAREGRNALVK